MKRVYLLFVFLSIIVMHLPGQWIKTSLPNSARVNSIANNGDTILAACDDFDFMYRSTDQGYTWSISNTGLTSKVEYLYFDGLNYFACTSNGLFISTDYGSSWVLRDNGMNVGVNSIIKINGYLFAGTRGSGIFRSSNNGLMWSNVSTGISIYTISCLAGDETKIYAGSTSNGITWHIYYSIDNGNSWISQNYTTTTKNVTGLLVYNGKVFATTTGYSFISTDGGQYWNIILNHSMTDCRSIARVSDKLFIGLYSKTFSSTNGIWMSTDEGVTWNSNMSLPSGNNYVTYITIIQNTLYASTSTGTWYRSLSDILPVELSDLSLRVFEDHIMIDWETSSENNNYGFEIERRNGANWYSIGFMKGNGTTNTKNRYSFKDTLLIYGNVEFRLKQIDNSGEYKYSKIVSVDNIGFQNYTLEQNYPNPFNPNTTIDYILPEESNVTLTIYDALGREINVKESQAIAGKHSYRWDASRMSSGIYIYKLTAVSVSNSKKQIFNDIKKMILLK